jgi:hypothetical protein
MKRLITLAMLTGFLAACGVDGEPTPPEPHAQTGLTITGTAEIGIAGRN